MAPKTFRLSRLQLILSDPTRMVEFVMAVCNIIVPSIAFLMGSVSLPQSTQTLLDHFWLDDRVMGGIGIILGLAQIWGAGTDWHDARAIIATCIACGMIALATAYWATGYHERPTVPLIFGTILGEMFLAWRCWHEKPALVTRNILHGRLSH